MTEALNQPRLVDSLSGAALLSWNRERNCSWAQNGVNAVESGRPFPGRCGKGHRAKGDMLCKAVAWEPGVSCSEAKFFTFGQRQWMAEVDRSTRVNGSLDILRR